MPRAGGGMGCGAALGAALMVMAGLVGSARAEVPRIEGPVTDLAGVLEPEVEATLRGRLREHWERTGVQMAVLVLPTTGGQPIEDLSMAVAERWGGGRAGEDRGVLLVLATKDRRSRLEMGQGLEEALPDHQAKRLLNLAVPALKASDYGAAVTRIVDGVVERTAHLRPGEAVVAPPRPLGSGGLDLVLVALLAAGVGGWYYRRVPPVGRLYGKRRKAAERERAARWVALRPWTAGLWVGGAALMALVFMGQAGFPLFYAAVWAVSATVGVLVVVGWRASKLYAVLAFVPVLALFVGFAVWSWDEVPMEAADLWSEGSKLYGLGAVWAVLSLAMFGEGGSSSGSGSTWSSSGSSSGGSSSSRSSGGYSGGGGRFGGGGASGSW